MEITGQNKLPRLGTIQVLPRHVFDFFRPTHLASLMMCSTLNHQKLPLSDPTHPPL